MRSVLPDPPGTATPDVFGGSAERPRLTGRFRLLVCVALLLALAACGAPAPAGVPAEALAFRGTTVDGAAFDGAALGGAPVVLWFWAPF